MGRLGDDLSLFYDVKLLGKCFDVDELSPNVMFGGVFGGLSILVDFSQFGEQGKSPKKENQN